MKGCRWAVAQGGRARGPIYSKRAEKHKNQRLAGTRRSVSWSSGEIRAQSPWLDSFGRIRGWGSCATKAKKGATNLLGLLDRPGEAVQDEAGLAIGAIEILLDHADHNVV